MFTLDLSLSLKMVYEPINRRSERLRLKLLLGKVNVKCRYCSSKIAIECILKCITQLLRALDHFVKSFVTLINQSIVILDLLIFSLNVEANALFLALQLRDLFVELTHL